MMELLHDVRCVTFIAHEPYCTKHCPGNARQRRNRLLAFGHTHFLFGALAHVGLPQGLYNTYTLIRSAKVPKILSKSLVCADTFFLRVLLLCARRARTQIQMRHPLLSTLYVGIVSMCLVANVCAIIGY